MENPDGEIREMYAPLPRGGIAYLESGPADGPVVIIAGRPRDIHTRNECVDNWGR